MTTIRVPLKCLTSLAAAAALSFAVAGCTITPQAGVSAGDGPAAASKPAASAPAASADAQPEHTTTTAEDTSDQGGPAQQVATFKDKITYADGVQVEVTKVSHHKVTAQQAEFPVSGEKAGDPYVILSIRLKNGSKTTLDAMSSVSVSYGPDGEEAETFYGGEGNDSRIDGKILPGKSKTGEWAFLIPAKYQSDVVAEVSFDFEHESAVFSGSLT